MTSFPPIRALLLQGSAASSLTSDGLLPWFVCVCLVATVVDQSLAVFGFMGLEAGGLELDPTCGLGSQWMFAAVSFLRQASGSERAKVMGVICCCVFVVLCVAAGEA